MGAKTKVLGAVNDAHATASQLGKNAVVGNGLADESPRIFVGTGRTTTFLSQFASEKLEGGSFHEFLGLGAAAEEGVYFVAETFIAGAGIGEEGLTVAFFES